MWRLEKTYGSQFSPSIMKVPSTFGLLNLIALSNFAGIN